MEKISITSDKGLRKSLIVWFIVFCGMFVLSGMFYELIILSLLSLTSAIVTFVFSIRHLLKYKDGMGFAITTLILSGIEIMYWVLVLMVGFVIGVMETI